ncbi:MAG: fibronectin type III domain-containing protein, partial [Patescibacteria group bacterium]
ENASTTLTINLSAITGIATADITGAQIFVDANANGAVDAEETTTAFGAGSVVISGATNNITFTAATSTVVSATSTRYILKATTTNLLAGDTITFGLSASNVTADGQTSKVRLTPVAPSPPANATHIQDSVPGQPGTPTYTNVSTSTLTASWTSATNADYYRLERALNCGTFSEIATTTALSRNDSGLATSTNYCYRVRGTNVNGNGPYSASSSVTTSGGGFSPSGSLVSIIIDTAVTAGVAPNSLFWEGSQPANTTVKFQFAASNATSGPWTYDGWNSSANICDSSSFYTVGINTPIEIKAVCHQNKRYIRYKVFLETTDSLVTPRVDRIILNYAQ